MQGNFTVFLTISENSKICIEPFSSLEEVEPICEKFELCEISEFEDIKIMTDPNRQFITLIMFNQVSTSKILTLFKATHGSVPLRDWTHNSRLFDWFQRILDWRKSIRH